MILNALEEQASPGVWRGREIRDWLYVDDHAEALLSVVERGRVGESYNIGGNSERRNIDVVLTVCDLVDELVPGREKGSSRDLLKFVVDRPGHDLRYAIDCGKVSSGARLAAARKL